MIELKVLTPYGTVLEQTVESITLPTKAGVITILQDHEPLVSLLSPGEMIVNIDKRDKSYAVSTGVLEIRENSKVYILAYSAEYASDINIAKAEEAKKKAEEELKKKTTLDDVGFARIQAIIEKETARINVGRKW